MCPIASNPVTRDVADPSAVSTDLAIDPTADLPAGLAKAPRQSRSRDRQRTLLAVGLKLTETRDWDALTIADIAAEAGVSVGSFYTRFRDKQAFLEVLVHTVARQMRGHIDAYTDEVQRSGLDARGMVESFVDEAIETYQRLRGVFRASILSRRHVDAGSPASAPLSAVFRDMRAHSRERFIETLAPRLDLPADEARPRLGFAHQMLNSTLINCMLTDPGPLRPGEPAFRQQMTEAMCAYLAIP